MDTFKRMLAVLGITVGLAAQGVPQEGQKAPDFTAVDQNGKTISLAALKGQKVVLYFYPKDDTPGCTAQACSLRDGNTAIQEAGAVILGVSADGQASHKAFAQKFNLPFSLLADPEKKIIEAYGVKMAVVGVAKRTTFIIDGEGTIRKVLRDIDTKQHDQQVLAALKELR